MMNDDTAKDRKTGEDREVKFDREGYKIEKPDLEIELSIKPDENALPIDIQILQLCHEKNWQYKQMINGKTLENQLFS